MPWLFITLTASILASPGPTNTLLASSGVQSGIAKSVRLIPAAMLGYGIAVSLWGYLVAVAAGTAPWLIPVIKILSAAFILFLAVRLWLSAAKQLEFGESAVTPASMFVATLLNPKAILLASTVFPATTWSSPGPYAANISAFLALVLASGILWISLGSILASRQNRWLTHANLQRIACLVLVGFALPIGYSGLASMDGI
jgi:threonine/homoserine/homoserine lactone efflux protein